MNKIRNLWQKYNYLLFLIVVYSVCVYLVSIREFDWVQLTGWSILFAHLYKDVTKMKKWPKWCEYAGFLIGAILIYEGIRVSNYLIAVIGVIKFSAHVRQAILKDDRLILIQVLEIFLIDDKLIVRKRISMSHIK